MTSDEVYIIQFKFQNFNKVTLHVSYVQESVCDLKK